MPATKQRPRRLSDAQLEQLLALTADADSVELKLTVPDSERRSTVAALGMDPLNAQIRQVYSVVKLRPVVPSELPDGLRKAKNLVVEVDAMPGGYVCSASFKGTLGTTDVKEVAAGKRAIRKLYSKEQRAFFTAHAPDGIGLDDLSVLGRSPSSSSSFRPWIRPAVGRRAVVLPRRLTNPWLSTKCAPTQGIQVAAETRAFLSSQGVDLLGEQQTKTKTALEYFSRNLDAAATA